jgi:hypothetical protein
MSIEGLNNLLKTYGTSESNTVIQVINMYKDILEMDTVPKNSNVVNDMSDNHINIDEVFINITKLYEPTILTIIYNILLLVQKEEDSTVIIHYIDGLNMITSKMNKMINEWIKVNLVF